MFKQINKNFNNKKNAMTYILFTSVPKLLTVTVGGLSSLAAVRQLLPDH